MNVPGRSDSACAAGFQPGRGGAAGAGAHISAPAATYRVRLVYEVDGCNDPLDALAELVAGLTDLSPGVHARLVDSGVI